MAFIQIENPFTPSKISSNATSSPSKTSPDLKILPAKKMALPTPAPSSQIGQKDEESSDSTQTESKTPKSSRIFGRYARRGTNSGDTLPLSPQSSKKSASNASFPSESSILEETLKRKVDERKSPLRKFRRRLSSSARTVSSSSNEDDVKPSLFRKGKQETPSARMTISSSNEGSSEDVVAPQRRKRQISRNMPDSPGNDSDPELPHHQVANDLQEDLDDLRDSSEFYVEYIMQPIDFSKHTRFKLYANITMLPRNLSF